MIEFLINYLKENPNMVVPLISALALITAALIALISTFISSQITGFNNIKVEKKKLESSLILKAIDTDDYRKSLDNLQFFLKIGLIKDHKTYFQKKGKLQKVIDGEIDIPIPALKKLHYEIIASNRNSIFAVQTTIKAKCEININEVKLNVESIELFLKENYNFESTFVTYIYAGLTKYTIKEKGVWDIMKKSNKIEINQQINKGKSIEIKDKIFLIDRSSIPDLENYWISFEIGQKDIDSNNSEGTTYLHYKEIMKIK